MASDDCPSVSERAARREWGAAKPPHDPREPVPITGLHLYRDGDYAVVAIEYGGRWVVVIRERCDGIFSHIVEPSGMRAAADALEKSHAEG
jgi:hypothetical protein